MPVILVHLASGVGNLVLATPLLRALADIGFTVDVRLDPDYPGSIELFRGWSAIRTLSLGKFPLPPHSYDRVVPAVPPFYWNRFSHLYRNLPCTIRRPKDSLFAADEQSYYLEFARALGLPADVRPSYELPIGPSPVYGVSASTVVLAPGCKTGEMAAKRWPWFSQLAERLSDVAVVGTRDDLPQHPFPEHVRSFVDRLSLRETAELLASAGLVVGNDTGLVHVAGAVGTTTLVLFGPTSEKVLGHLPDHVHVLRSGLPCEPCWTSKRLQACRGTIDCLAQLAVDRVERTIRQLTAQFGNPAPPLPENSFRNSKAPSQIRLN